MGRRTLIDLPANTVTARGGTSQADFGAKGGLGRGGLAARAINRLETVISGYAGRHLTLSELKRLAIVNGVAGGVRGYRTLTG